MGLIMLIIQEDNIKSTQAVISEWSIGRAKWASKVRFIIIPQSFIQSLVWFQLQLVFRVLVSW